MHEQPESEFHSHLQSIHLYQIILGGCNCSSDHSKQAGSFVHPSASMSHQAISTPAAILSLAWTGLRPALPDPLHHNEHQLPAPSHSPGQPTWEYNIQANQQLCRQSIHSQHRRQNPRDRMRNVSGQRAAGGCSVRGSKGWC